MTVPTCTHTSLVFGDELSAIKKEFHKSVSWRTFYKQGPVWRWICTSFDTERWSSPSYKRSRSGFRTTDGKWNSIKCLRFVRDRRMCSSLFSSAHGAPPGPQLFSERIIKLYHKYDKTKDIWRMQYYSYRYSRLIWNWVKLCVLWPL